MRNNGFLLLEALISLSLLVVGLMACAETFSFVHEASRRNAQAHELAAAAQSKIYETALGIALPAAESNSIQWTVEKTSLSPSVEKIVLRTTDETFETFHINE